MEYLYLGPKTIWKFGLIWLPKPLDMVLAILAQIWFNFGKNGPILTL